MKAMEQQGVPADVFSDIEKAREFANNNKIGYVVMINFASLLATRLRKTNLQLIACFLWE